MKKNPAFECIRAGLPAREARLRSEDHAVDDRPYYVPGEGRPAPEPSSCSGLDGGLSGDDMVKSAQLEVTVSIVVSTTG